ncbi:dsDNA-specific endonuclease/ATPase MutS2 [Bacillus fengqiuensis]|nr:dsDNA-specific endonuclease/ATPase MutS2 [Bacillus fengqiuensis]
MKSIWNKKLLVGGMAATLTLGGLTACGDGVDQDNGVSDGEQQDELDKENEAEVNEAENQAENEVEQAEQEAESEMKQAEQEAEKGANEIEKKMEDSGIGDGVDQDNGISDGEKKDELDNKNPETN